MSKSLQFALGTLALTVLSGCTSQHQQLVHFPDQKQLVEDPEKARIYVIREPWLWNLASHMQLVTVRDGDTTIGSIAGHRGYLCWEREPGQANISCAGDKGGILVTVEKGRAHYILQHLEPVWGTMVAPGGGQMATRLESVNEERGKRELSKCKPPTSSN